MGKREKEFQVSLQVHLEEGEQNKNQTSVCALKAA